MEWEQARTILHPLPDKEQTLILLLCALKKTIWVRSISIHSTLSHSCSRSCLQLKFTFSIFNQLFYDEHKHSQYVSLVAGNCLVRPKFFRNSIFSFLDQMFWTLFVIVLNIAAWYEESYQYNEGGYYQDKDSIEYNGNNQSFHMFLCSYVFVVIPIDPSQPERGLIHVGNGVDGGVRIQIVMQHGLKAPFVCSFLYTNADRIRGAIQQLYAEFLVLNLAPNNNINPPPPPPPPVTAFLLMFRWTRCSEARK